MRNERALDLARLVARGQGLYYLGTGLWPLVSMRTFEAVTGPKHDRWLVRVVGLLAIAFGALVLREANRPRPDPGPGLAGSAAFGTASLWNWASGRLNHAYALDGVAEAATFGAWLALSSRATRRFNLRADRDQHPRPRLNAVL